MREREQHSADGRSYIEYEERYKLWAVYFDGKEIDARSTRELARIVIRAEKFNKFAHARFPTLGRFAYRELCIAQGLNPEDGRLKSRLIELGWRFMSAAEEARHTVRRPYLERAPRGHYLYDRMDPFA